MAEPATVLVVEDDELLRTNMCDMLGEAGHDVVGAATVAEARAVIAARPLDLAVLDIGLDGDTPRTPVAARGGFRLLEALRQDGPGVPVVFVTGERAAETAVDLMTRGAYHYLTKPVKRDVLLNIADLAIELGRARRRLATFSATQRRDVPEWYVGDSPGMRQAASHVALYAPTDHPVLILGETGTGKEVVARTIHAQSERASVPLVTVNCATVSRDLIASELFGHVPGAFTGADRYKRGYFEEASGGTLFLDEIGEMSKDLQAHLLRAIQFGTIRRVGDDEDRRVDVRIIAATNVDLEAKMAAGEFRPDLYYRLGLEPVRLTPLRERPGDVPYLAGMFLAQARARKPDGPSELTPRAARALMAYPWPGNTRELEAVVAHAGLLARGEPAIDLAHLPRFVTAGAPPGAALNGHGPDAPDAPFGPSPILPADLPAEGLDLIGVRDAWEERMIRQALARTGNVQTVAADLLGISRDQLRGRLEKFEA